MLRRVTLVRIDVLEEPSASINQGDKNRWTRNDSCHPDDGGANFFRNVGSYKSQTP
jgi:hypothetical protein